MKVPLFDPVQEDARVKGLEDVQEVVASGRLVDGIHRDALENELADFFEVRSVACVATGTDALEAAIRAYKQSEHPEVAVPANTFIGTVSAIRAAGCKPVYVDVDKNGLVREEAVSTEGCIVVDLCGHKATRKQLASWTIVDACQSLFSGEGRTSCYSFHPTKPLGGYGTGGAVAGTRAVTDQVKLWRWHGSNGGRNSRLPEIQASVLRKKLPWAKDKIIRRREIARMYLENITRANHTRPEKSHWHTYPILLSGEIERDYVGGKLLDAGIQTKPAYEPLTDKCPKAVKWSQQVLYLPIWAGMTDRQVQYVIEKCQEIL